MRSFIPVTSCTISYPGHSSPTNEIAKARLLEKEGDALEREPS